MDEPKNGSYVLIDANAVWVRDDDISNKIDGDDLDHFWLDGHPGTRHWWELDGGHWQIDPVRWDTLFDGARTVEVLTTWDQLKPTLPFGSKVS